MLTKSIGDKHRLIGLHSHQKSLFLDTKYMFKVTFKTKHKLKNFRFQQIIVIFRNSPKIEFSSFWNETKPK